MVIHAGLSDHDLIGCVRKMNNIKYKSKTIHYRNFKNYDANTINNKLLNKDWNPVYQTTSPTSSLSYITKIFKETLDMHAPFITKKNQRETISLDNKRLDKAYEYS